ncbi:hypothetical protein FRC11_013695 [Ceratobasidium sp. 423]|nr:hypothetical protein FRC11_013695 [Ceratobasidium sp. 423]
MEIIEMSWAYPGPWKSDDQDAERTKGDNGDSDRRIGDIEYNVPAAMIARRLLKELGRPDALFVEMLAVGERFLCGRCDEYMCPVEWPVLVDHYLYEHETWEQKLKDHPDITSHPSIEYRNLHDFSDYDKPTVVLVSRTEQKRLFRQDGHQVGKMMRCRLCKQLGLSYTSTKRDHLEFHVKNVHGVTD